MYINTFKYTPKDVSCQLCTEYVKKLGCTALRCPWLAERIEAGVVGYREAVLETFPHERRLFQRLNLLIKHYPGSLWSNEQHERRMQYQRTVQGYRRRRDTNAYYAAMYLLTSNDDIYLNAPKPENMPLLEDLYNALRAQDEKEAQYIATALEIYVTGSLNVFNHHTNVDVNSRIVCYDIKELGKQLKKIGMLVVQDQVWNRVTINRAAHKTTRYYLDEFHLLLKEEQTASYSVEIWKRYRKWGGIPTGITQNVKDLLSSREVENIFENSDFIYMLNQAAGDRQILAKQLNISPHQLSYVTHSGEGEGLLFYGNTILPFIDHFPKDTELYRVMTTKPQEVASA